MEVEDQTRFRVKISIVDYLFTLTQNLEKKAAFDQELHILFIDVKKACDKTLYRNTKAKAKTNEGLSTGFCINKGFKQDCPMSPTLFKIVLESSLKN